ncbi:MAG TPA: DUF4328 domain-containing protein [Acidimicrobiales bacterium]|nr:DUF4328 domain-containing protein [Acidimicrobiales bacterium]
MISGPLPGPGWHPDPGNPNFWRWWDGSTWTAHVAPRAPAFRSPVDLLAAEEVMAPWARAAVVIYPIIAFTLGVVGFIYAPQLRLFFHELRLAFDAAQNDNTGFVLPPSPSVPDWNLWLSPFSIAARIVFLIWQYRAARVARQLGYPARHSPGWGVAFWFIPVVNFWMPYQAIRDCLPPGHPERKSVLQIWLLLLVSVVAVDWLTIGSGYARPIGVVVLVGSGLLEAFVAFRAYRVVMAVGEQHRQGVASQYQRPRF